MTNPEEVEELGHALGIAINGLVAGGGARFDCHTIYGHDCRIYWVNEVLRVDIRGLRDKPTRIPDATSLFKEATEPYWVPADYPSEEERV